MYGCQNWQCSTRYPPESTTKKYKKTTYKKLKNDGVKVENPDPTGHRKILLYTHTSHTSCVYTCHTSCIHTCTCIYIHTYLYTYTHVMYVCYILHTTYMNVHMTWSFTYMYIRSCTLDISTGTDHPWSKWTVSCYLKYLKRCKAHLPSLAGICVVCTISLD
jgi:hypothetical protein